MPEQLRATLVTDPLLTRIVDRLVGVYHPDRVYLFGSAARGEAGPDSDYDIMILVPDDAPAHLRTPDAGYLAVEGLGRSGDFLVWSRSRFESRKELKSSLPATILREGKLLYAA